MRALFRNKSADQQKKKYIPKTGRDIYQSYREKYKHDPKDINHLLAYSKQLGANMTYETLKEVFTNPPGRPKEELETGGWLWEDDSNDEDSYHFDADGESNLVYNINRRYKDDDDTDMSRQASGDSSDTSSDEDSYSLSDSDGFGGRITTHISHLNRRLNINDAIQRGRMSTVEQLSQTQVITMGDMPMINRITKLLTVRVSDRSNKTDINRGQRLNGPTLADVSGYTVMPLTPHMIIVFHLDIPVKQWQKQSKNFLETFERLMCIDRRDYNILSVVKYIKTQLECIVGLLLRHPNDNFPDTNKYPKEFKLKVKEVLAPMMRTFQDSKWIVKLLKDLKFSDLDVDNSQQVDKQEFDNYFNTKTAEPLDQIVLDNLFRTLDEDGDGEITALEFFRWKTTFTANKLISMFPIIEYKIKNEYQWCTNPKMTVGFKRLQSHIYKHIQDHPMQFCIENIFYLNNQKKADKFHNLKAHKNSKLLFLLHKSGFGDRDITSLLSNSISKKGRYFENRGFYGQGYYLTSDVQYALHDIFLSLENEFERHGMDVQLLNSHNQYHTYNTKRHHQQQQYKHRNSSMSNSGIFKSKGGKENSVSFNMNLLDIGSGGKHIGTPSMGKKNTLRGDDDQHDLSHGEYTLLICMVNPGIIDYIREFRKGKKIGRSYQSNYISNIVGEWENQHFGAPDSIIEETNNLGTIVPSKVSMRSKMGSTINLLRRGFSHDDDEDEQKYVTENRSRNRMLYYTGRSFDCYIIKDHERILPQYAITLKRMRQCFVWMDENYTQLKTSAMEMIKARRNLAQYLPHMIYVSDNMKDIIKLIRIKMKYSEVFLLRFIGIDINMNTSILSFINYIRGNMKTVTVNVYPLTIIHNVITHEQSWNLIITNRLKKMAINVSGSAQMMFNYIKQQLYDSTEDVETEEMEEKKSGGHHSSDNIGRVRVLLLSIRFIKHDDEIQEIIDEQKEDALDMQQQLIDLAEAEEEEEMKKSDQLQKKISKKDLSSIKIDDPSDLSPKSSKFKITIQPPTPGVDEEEEEKKIDTNSLQSSSSDDSEYDEHERMLNAEKIEKLIELRLPVQVSKLIGDQKDFQLPANTKDLERDLRKMVHGLHGEKSLNRKYAKLVYLRYYEELCAIYYRYCKLGGDLNWMTRVGWHQLLKDANIPEKKANSACTESTCDDLFHVVFDMHHKLKATQKQIEQGGYGLKRQASHVKDFFFDDDPWTGIWSPVVKKSAPNAGDIYKIRRIGDSKLVGCWNSMEYAELYGSFEVNQPIRAKLTLEFKHKRRAGVKRSWEAELIPPKSKDDAIIMKVLWFDRNSIRAANEKLTLRKTDERLRKSDIDLPFDMYFGFSRHEFFDAILTLSTLKYTPNVNNDMSSGRRVQYIFQSIHKLINDNLIAYIYRNIYECEINRADTNVDISKALKLNSSFLRKIYKVYSTFNIAGDDEIMSGSAVEVGLSEDKWIAFVYDLFKIDKNFWKEYGSNGGKPNAIDIKIAFILCKNEENLSKNEISFPEFQVALILLTNYICKFKPNPKYKYLKFNDKLMNVIKWCIKISNNRSASRASSKGMIKMKSERDRANTLTLTSNTSLSFGNSNRTGNVSPYGLTTVAGVFTPRLSGDASPV